MSHNNQPHNFENVGLTIFESIDWTEVPQTPEQYAEFTGAPMHRTLPDDDPRRPDYHGLGLSFPHHSTLPNPGMYERWLLSYNSLDDFVTGEHGQRIIKRIMLAATDGKLSANEVFDQPVPSRATLAEGTGSTATLIRQEITATVAEDEHRLSWWRNKRFLVIGAAATSIGLMGVMMTPVFGETPVAEQAGPDCDPDPSNGVSC